MGKPLRVLMVEDSEDDVLLVIHALKKGGYDPVYERVEGAGTMRDALRNKPWDVILCDHQMPQFNAFAAIALLKETGIDIPFIIVSGAIGEETAVECMRLGACDYVMKDNLSRLVPAIERELKEAESRIQRKQAEEALRKSESAYRTLFEDSLMAISQASPDGRLIRVNMAYAKMYGYEGPDEMMDEVSDIGQQLYANPEDRKEVLRILAEKGVMEPREFPVVRRDGTLFDVLVAAKEIRDTSGTLVCFQATHVDVTERKKAETKLRSERDNLAAIMRSSPVGLLIIDEHEFVVSANPAAERLFCRKLSELPHRRCGDFIGCINRHADSAGCGHTRHCSTCELYRNVKNVLAGGQGITNHEMEAVAEAGERTTGIWLLFSVEALLLNNRRHVILALHDITDYKRLQEEIEKERARIRQYLDIVGVIIVGLATDQTITLINQKGCELLGYAQNELIGKNWFDMFLPGRERENTGAIFARLLNGELEPLEFVEGHVITRSGKERIIGWHNALVHDAMGHIVGTLSAGEDITDRRRAEDSLKASEENFRSSLDDSPLGVRVVTGEGETIFTNRAILDIYGYHNREELKATPVEKRYTPESYVEFQIRRGKRKRGDYNPSEYNISIVRKDGEVRHLQVFRKEVLWDGERQFQVIYQDITERKQAEEGKRRMEERSRKVVEDIFRFIPEGVLVFSRKMELLRQNQAFRGLASGYAKRLGFTGYELENLIVDKIKATMGDKKVKEIRISSKHEPREKTFDGFEELVLELDMARILFAEEEEEEEEEEARIVVSIKDTTERKKAEAVLLASREQMRALAGRLQAVREEERTLIAREIHDELGGALTGLKIDVSLLTRTAMKIENETVRTSVLAGMDSMTKFTDATIQTVRRIAMELRPGVLDDLGLVAALEWQLKDFAKRTGIRYAFIPPGEEISFDADLSTALFRIFQEALTNVIRHSAATEVRVRFRINADSSTLEVEDNGKGIEKEKTLSSKSLGLLGMRERAEIFGGRITITGLPGIGTKMTVKIPYGKKSKRDRYQEGAAG